MLSLGFCCCSCRKNGRMYECKQILRIRHVWQAGLMYFSTVPFPFAFSGHQPCKTFDKNHCTHITLNDVEIQQHSALIYSCPFTGYAQFFLFLSHFCMPSTKYGFHLYTVQLVRGIFLIYYSVIQLILRLIAHKCRRDT